MQTMEGLLAGHGGGALDRLTAATAVAVARAGEEEEAQLATQPSPPAAEVMVSAEPTAEKPTDKHPPITEPKEKTPARESKVVAVAHDLNVRSCRYCCLWCCSQHNRPRLRRFLLRRMHWLYVEDEPLLPQVSLAKLCESLVGVTVDRVLVFKEAQLVQAYPTSRTRRLLQTLQQLRTFVLSGNGLGTGKPRKACIWNPTNTKYKSRADGILDCALKSLQVSLVNRFLVWQSVFLAGAIVVGAFIRRRQWERICRDSREPGSLNVVDRIEKVEEDLRSSTTIVRVLSRQLEKLGIRFRVTRKTLKEPINEAAALAQKNSEATRALAMQEEMLERELAEIQNVCWQCRSSRRGNLNLFLLLEGQGS